MDRKFRRILVIRPEKLGDLVVSSPVFRALRHSYPEARITILTDMLHGCILQDDPHVDEVLAIRWKWRTTGSHESIFSIVRKLEFRRFDLALILYPNWSWWNMIVALAGIRRVVQLGGTWGAILLGHQVIRRRALERHLHYRDYYLEVAAECGATMSPQDDRMPKVFLNLTERQAFLDRYPGNPSHKRIILHPFGHGSSPNYSLDSYARFALRLVEELSVEVWLTGGPQDLANWRELSHPRIRNDWLGTLTLREMMAACAVSDAVVCGSTGIIHLAAALGTPTVGLFCPHPGSHPKAWGPLGSQSLHLIVPEAICHKMNKSGNGCMVDKVCDLSRGISYASVITAVQEVLKHSSQ